MLRILLEIRSLLDASPSTLLQSLLPPEPSCDYKEDIKLQLLIGETRNILESHRFHVLLKHCLDYSFLQLIQNLRLSFVVDTSQDKSPTPEDSHTERPTPTPFQNSNSNSNNSEGTSNSTENTPTISGMQTESTRFASDGNNATGEASSELNQLEQKAPPAHVTADYNTADTTNVASGKESQTSIVGDATPMITNDSSSGIDNNTNSDILTENIMHKLNQAMPLKDDPMVTLPMAKVIPIVRKQLNFVLQPTYNNVVDALLQFRALHDYSYAIFTQK